MKELCYILIGKRIGRFWFGRLVKKTTGTASSVEFDWEWVLRREEEKGDIIGFWHSHGTEGTPSDRDVDTMLAWADCFYKPLLCIIQDSFRKQGFSVMHVEVATPLVPKDGASREQDPKLYSPTANYIIPQRKIKSRIKRTQGILVAWFPLKKICRLDNLFIGVE